MSNVTVSKLRIAQAKECVVRADKYSAMLRVILELCQIALPLATDRRFPDDFSITQKRSWETIIGDLKSMSAETADMALYKAEKAEDLARIRERQLGKSDGEQ